MIDGFDQKTEAFECSNSDFKHTLSHTQAESYEADAQYQQWLEEQRIHQLKVQEHAAKKAVHDVEMAKWNAEKEQYDRDMAHAMAQFRKWYAASDPHHLRQKGYRLTYLGTVDANGVPVQGYSQLGQFEATARTPCEQTHEYTALHGTPIPPDYLVTPTPPQPSHSRTRHLGHHLRHPFHPHGEDHHRHHHGSHHHGERDSHHHSHHHRYRHRLVRPGDPLPPICPETIDSSGSIPLPSTIVPVLVEVPVTVAAPICLPMEAPLVQRMGVAASTPMAVASPACPPTAASIGVPAGEALHTHIMVAQTASTVSSAGVQSMCPTEPW